MRRIAVLAALALAGCSDDREASRMAEEQDGGNRGAGRYVVDAETGAIDARIRRDDGSLATMRSGSDVPVALPPGFSLYPEAAIVANTRVEHSEGSGVHLVLRSEATPREIAEFYRREAEASGIAIDVALGDGQRQVLAGRGEGEDVFTFNASEESEGTVVHLSLGTGASMGAGAAAP